MRKPRQAWVVVHDLAELRDAMRLLREERAAENAYRMHQVAAASGSERGRSEADRVAPRPPAPGRSWARPA